MSTIYVRTTDTNALFYDGKSGAGENEVDDLKEIIQEFRASFTEFRAEAKDRETRYLTKIRLLTEKVSSLESTVSSIEKHATEREEKLMKKLSSLSAKVGDLNVHAKAVRTRTATTGTHTPDTIDHDPPTPPMTNNSTAVGEPTPFPPSNHDHIPAVQRLGLDSDSATGPQPTYRACLKVSGYEVIGWARGKLWRERIRTCE